MWNKGKEGWRENRRNPVVGNKVSSMTGSNQEWDKGR